MFCWIVIAWRKSTQNPQVSVNFLHFITVAPFIQVHIILNASISISSFCLFWMNVWCGNSSGETWNENINCSCHGCRLRNNFFFSTWPKRQDYRFTQPRTCNLLSQERKKKWTTKWHTTLLKCLFLLQFDKCWEENVVCQLDETEKLANGWLRWVNIYI